MESIKLEFLRHGPPHNHLLSPLTQYLAICGDHAADTVRVPFEHAVLAARLRQLGATGPVASGDRQQQLDELAANMGSILAQVHGLIADFCNCAAEGEIAHLRLVLSANELALLPFELAAGGPGLPGAGQHLALQSVVPVCITREIRSRSGSSAPWPRRCRILLAAASPPGVPAVPIEAHLLALREAIDPWMRYYYDEDPHHPTDMEAAVSEHLDVLIDASPRRLTDAIATGGYTHIHLLAHGAGYHKGDDKRFGLALHDDLDPTRMDVLDGERLATVIRSREEDGGRALALPCMVTLATCDSANVGGVIGNGASLAHELHRAGIPLVIASQFPLSYPGSVHLARLLYGPLLAGQHPCLVLDHVRRQLLALVPQHHDWAGLVVYAALPPDLSKQLLEVRYQRGRAAIEAAMSHLDSLSHDMSTRYSGHRGRSDEELLRDLHAALERFRIANETLERLLADVSSDRTSDIHGLLGGAEKRVADMLWRWRTFSKSLAPLAPNRAKPRKGRAIADPDSWQSHLERAKQHYLHCFATDRAEIWALVQALAMHSATKPEVKGSDWNLARLLSERDRDFGNERRAVWALNNLVELAVLGLVPAEPPVDESRPTSSDGVVPAAPAATASIVGDRSDAAEAVAATASDATTWKKAMWQMANSAVDRLLTLRPPEDMDVHSLRRQMLRYDEGFLDHHGQAARLAKHLFKRLEPHAD